MGLDRVATKENLLCQSTVQIIGREATVRGQFTENGQKVCGGLRGSLASASEVKTSSHSHSRMLEMLLNGSLRGGMGSGVICHSFHNGIPSKLSKPFRYEQTEKQAIFVLCTNASPRSSSTSFEWNWRVAMMLKEGRQLWNL